MTPAAVSPSCSLALHRLQPTSAVTAYHARRLAREEAVGSETGAAAGAPLRAFVPASA